MSRGSLSLYTGPIASGFIMRGSRSTASTQSIRHGASPVADISALRFRSNKLAKLCAANGGTGSWVNPPPNASETPNMLRHAAGFVLANKGTDTGTLQT